MSLIKQVMFIKSKSSLIILTIATIFLVGCNSNNVAIEIDNPSNNFSLDAVHGVTPSLVIEKNSWPTKILLNSDDRNVARKIDVEEREECYKKHSYGFETYSGDFITKSSQKLNRLSYPEKGSNSLFVVDEYGYTLSNGNCLTFSYTAIVENALSSNGEYDDSVYSDELSIASEIMSSLKVPNE